MIYRTRGASVVKGAKGVRNKPHISLKNGRWQVSKYCPFGIRNLQAEEWVNKKPTSHGAGVSDE